MAFNTVPFHGKVCRIEKGGTNLEYNVDWTLNVALGMAEGRRMGQQWDEKYPGWVEWDGGFKGSFAPGNTEQKAFFDNIVIATPGTKITDVDFNLDSSINYFEGDLFINRLRVDVAVDNTVTFDIRFKGNSALNLLSAMVLLIHSNDSDGSTTFVDSGNGPNCPHTITAVGDAHHEADQKKFGISSIYFDGSGSPTDKLSIPDNIDWDLTSIFTIDFWFKTDTSNQCCLLNTADAHNANEYQIELNRSAGKLSVYSAGQKCITTNSWNDGSWHHLALICDGTDLKMYIDGTKDGEELGYAPSWTPTGMYIGGTYGDNIEPYTGYMDEIRILKGVAYWTSNFTPPIAAY